MTHWRAVAVSSFLGLSLGLAACASGTSGGVNQPESVQPVVIPGQPQQQRTVLWPIKTREHIDLWLHGFALLQTDSTAPIPLFRRGYATDVTVMKNRANIITQLDANRDRLQAGLSDGRLVNAQFLPFYFNSIDEMRGTIEHFVSVQGNQNAARSQREATLFAVLASYFQSAGERAWLALFSSGLWDEDARFFRAYWTQQQHDRAATIDAVQTEWQQQLRPKLSRFLSNTQQRDGDIFLSLPLGGEGRTMSGSTGQRAAVAVTFPERTTDANQAMYVIAHELVGAIANSAIADNTTPADQRNGVADRLAAPAAVRGGLMLLEKLAPELSDGYARYYLTAAGRRAGTNPRTELVAAFPIPDAIRDAIAHQIDAVQGGI